MLTSARQLAPAVLEIRVPGGRLPSLQSLPALAVPFDAFRSVAVLFVGPADTRVIEPTADLHRRCRERGQTISADFLLDGDADACAVLGAQTTSLGVVLEISRALRAAGVTVRWRVPVLEPLVYRLEALFSLADDESVDAVLVPATPPAGGLNPESRRFVRDFTAYRLLDEQKGRLSAARASFYQAWLVSLDGVSPRGGPDESIAVVEPDEGGEWVLRREVRSALSPALDQAPVAAGTSTAPGGTAEPLREIAGVLAEGVRALGQWLGAALVGRARPDEDGGSRRALPRVLVIGAYGGDHIGDTAIVGGVLLRMHRRYGTRQAILVSQRPEHTARLAAMLDIPVDVTVQEYRQSSAAALVRQSDGVVFAGGPLMDLPKQLVKHLYTVALARRAGKPFVIEGIGAGPFIRRVSAWTARLLVRMAERITVRTAEDARQPLVQGLDPLVGRDPAFDYLDTRGVALTRIPDEDRRWLDRLLDGAVGRVTIGINLRPLRPDYTVGPPAAQRASHTRLVEARFEERLAEAMKRFHRASRVAPCFIFFPMNAIQFGSSDLRSAYRLKRLVGDEVDLRVWEGDPSIDGVVALLRRVDVAVTMRFHATIYAVSQQRPVIGIDYRPGKRDKVAALLDDMGQGHNCGRVDEITAEWMFDRLVALSETVGDLRPAGPAAGTAGSSLQPVQPPDPR